MPLLSTTTLQPTNFFSPPRYAAACTAGSKAPYGGRPRKGTWPSNCPRARRACPHWAVAWPRVSVVRLGWDTVWSPTVPPALDKGPPVRQVPPGGPLDEEGRHRQPGPAHDRQDLRARGPAVVHRDVDGPAGRAGEGVERSFGQGAEGDADHGLLTVPAGQGQLGPAGTGAVRHGHLPRRREADLVLAAQRLVRPRGAGDRIPRRGSRPSHGGTR